MQIQSCNTKQIYNYSVNGSKSICPECSHLRKKPLDKCLSWSKSKGVGKCHNCDTSFHIYKEKEDGTPVEWTNSTKLDNPGVKYCEGRMISQDTLNKAGIYTETTYFGKEVKTAIVFPFFKDGKVVNHKYRSREKDFKLDPKAELVLFNQDCIKDNTEIIITEGEFDALAFMEVGFDNVVSVPNGTGTNVDNIDLELFKHVSKIYIAGDTDEPGQELRDKLIDKFGKKRCYIVSFGEKKDANEYLSEYCDELWDVIKDAIPVVKNPLPLLPIDGFPPMLRKVIQEYSRVYGTHRDLWAGSFLGAICAAIGDTIRLRTKYDNSAVLWIAMVAPTGVGKTEPLFKAFAPIHERDAEKKKIFDNEKAEYERAEGKKSAIPKPVFKQIIITDVTPEKVCDILAFNPRGSVIQMDELMSWIKNFNRYNKGSEEENWTAAWSQKPMTVSRMKEDTKKVMNPFLCVAGGLQPAFLSTLASDNRDVSGFFNRFCFVYPDKITRPYSNDEQISSVYSEWYKGFIKKLLDLEGPVIEYVTLSEGAKSILREWEDRNTDEINSNDPLRGMLSKLPIIVQRIALALHVCHWAETDEIYKEIKPETMKSALEMTEYFKQTGAKVAGEVDRDNIDKMNDRVVTKYLNATKGYNAKQIADFLKVSRMTTGRYLK